MEPIPERRPQAKVDQAMGKTTKSISTSSETAETSDTNRKLYYCKICGYVAFREEAPLKCPICQAKQEMFGEIVFNIGIKAR